MTPDPVAFTERAIGTISPDVVLTVSNGTASSVTYNGLTFAGANPTEFGTDNGATCSTGQVIPASGSCTVPVNFRPDGPGNFNGVAQVNDSAGTQTVSLSGNAVTAPHIVEVFPSFGTPGSFRGVTTGKVNGVKAVWAALDNTLVEDDTATTPPTVTSYSLGNGPQGQYMAHGVAIGQGPQANTVWMSAGAFLLRWAPGGSNGVVTVYPLPPPVSSDTSAQDAVWVDAGGSVWVTAKDFNVLAKYNPAGAGTWNQYPLPTPGAGPLGLVADSVGNLYVAAANTPQIFKFITSTSSWGTPINLPSGVGGTHELSMDSSGKFFFTDPNDNRVGYVDPAGPTVTVSPPLATTQAGPEGVVAIAPTSTGPHAYITDAAGSKVEAVSYATGTSTWSFKRYAVPPDPFGCNHCNTTTPTGIARAADGNIYFATPESLDEVGLHGAASTAAPVPKASPPALNFGNQAVGTRSDDQTTVMSNTGTADLHLGRVLAVSGANPGNFVVRGYACTYVTVLPPTSPFFGGGCTFSVEFLPTAVQSYSATVSLYTDASTTPFSFTVSGVGTAQSSFTKNDTVTAASGPSGIATDAAGNLWFTEATDGDIGKAVPGGGGTATMSEFPVSGAGFQAVCQIQVPTTGGGGSSRGIRFGGSGGGGSPGFPCPVPIVLGSDGNMWFIENGFTSTASLDSITPAGVITAYPNSAMAGALGLAAMGSYIYVAIGSSISEFTTSGILHNSWTLTTSAPITSLASGPNSNLWFTQSRGCTGCVDDVGELNTSNGGQLQFNLAAGNTGVSALVGIGPNSLAFVETQANKVGVITSTGSATATVGEFAIPTTEGFPGAVALVGTSTLVFTLPGADKVATMSTTGTGFTDYSLPLRHEQPYGIVAVGGAAWFTGFSSSSVGMFTVPTAAR